MDVVVTAAYLHSTFPDLTASDVNRILRLSPPVQERLINLYLQQPILAMTYVHRLAALSDQAIGLLGMDTGVGLLFALPTLKQTVLPTRSEYVRVIPAPTSSQPQEQKPMANPLSQLVPLVSRNAMQFVPALERRTGQAFDNTAAALRWMRANWSSSNARKLIIGAFADIGINTAVNALSPSPTIDVQATTVTTTTTTTDGAALSPGDMAGITLLRDVLGSNENILAFKSALMSVTADQLVAYTNIRRTVRGL